MSSNHSPMDNSKQQIETIQHITLCDKRIGGISSGKHSSQNFHNSPSISSKGFHDLLSGQPATHLQTGSFGTRKDEDESNGVADQEESSITVLKVNETSENTLSISKSIDINGLRKRVSDIASTTNDIV